MPGSIRSWKVWLNENQGLVVAISVLSLFAAGFLVRLWGISRAHYWDEMVYLQNAQVICCGKTNYSELSFRPPLLSIVFAGAFLLWRHVYAACIAAAAINALGPVFLLLAGCMAVGRLPAAIASLLLAFSPFFAGVFPAGFVSDDTGNSLLTDSPALTLILLAFWLLLRAIEKQSLRRFFFAGVVLALCILMRFGSIPSVGMLLLLPLAARQRWRAVGACASGLAIAMAPYLVWSKLRYGGFLATLQAGWRNVEGPVEPFSFFITNAAKIFSYVAVVGLLLALVTQLLRYRSWSTARQATVANDGVIAPRFSITAYLWFWLLAGLLFFSLMPHKEPRYVMPLAPPVLLLAGSGLAFVCSLPKFKALGVTAVCAAMVITFLPIRERVREPFINPIVPDEEVASRFLESAVPPATTLYMSFNYPAFAFYTNFRIHELSSVGPALYADMEQIPLGGVLIVYREAEAPSQSDIAWVNANPKFQRLREFPSLVIYRSVARDISAPIRP